MLSKFLAKYWKGVKVRYDFFVLHRKEYQQERHQKYVFEENIYITNLHVVDADRIRERTRIYLRTVSGRRH